MGVFPIGDQRVGIEIDTPTLVGGQPVYSEFGEPVTTATLVWVDRAAFEIQTPSEQQNLTVTTSEVAWAILPVVDGTIPAVDGQGNPAPLPVFGNGGAPSVSSRVWLHHNGLRYAMRGDAVYEQSIRGVGDHLFCVCERQQ